VLRELAVLYSALSAGQPSPLPYQRAHLVSHLDL